MRILSFDFEPASDRGGQEKSLFDILIGLKSLGHDIVLGYVVEGDLLPSYRSQGIQCLRLSRANIQHKFSPIQWCELFTSAYRLSRQEGDVLYLNQIIDGPLGVATKLLRRIPYIVCHLRLPPMTNCGQVRLSTPRIDRFITANSLMRDLHAEAGFPEDRIDIIPNGLPINSNVHFQKRTFEKLNIAFLGRFHPVKGLALLIEALGIARRAGLNFQLSIGGKPRDQKEEAFKERLIKKAQEYNVNDSINWAGFVKDPEQFLSKHDLCVFPSQWDEPFGRVMVESLLAYTPVIASLRGSSREILNDPQGKWLFSDAPDLARKLVAFADDPEAYPLEEKYTYVRKRYDLKIVVPQIESCLLRALSSSRKTN